MLCEEFFIPFLKIRIRRREKRSEFGFDYFTKFRRKWGGQGGKDVLQTDEIVMQSWIRGREGMCFEDTAKSKKVLFYTRLVKVLLRTKGLVTSHEEDLKAQVLSSDVFWAILQQRRKKFHCIAKRLRSLS